MANPLIDVFGEVPQGQPPGDELGAAHQVGAPGGWAPFLDEAEYVPELTWPSSIATYHRMRSDTQIEALHLGSTQPVREYRWMIDPNGAPSRLVENAATDLGLPIKTPEEEGDADQGHVKRAATKFNFGTFLEDVLSGPLYGFMPFEIVGEVEEGKDWRMRKLAPRHPRTIQQFKESRHGDLEAIRQTFGPDFTIMPEPIPATSLVHFVWRGEAGSHVGRSMLRSMYREWLVKERVIRILPINIERAGGVPWVEGPQGASNKQLAELGTLARQFKVAEGGGGALPFGSKLNLAGIGGGVPDGLGLLTYCDEAMARVWALMLIQLGQTATGSRALGGEFAIYAARAQRLMGKWVTDTVNDFLDRYVEWNEPLADYAPRLIFEPSQPEGLSVTDLVSLLDAGALTVDPELETWLRAEYSLPKKPEAPEQEDLGELTPDEMSLVQNSRNPPPLPDYTANPNIPTAPGGAEPGGKTFTPTPGPKKALDPTSVSPTAASGSISLPRLHRGIRASLTLPARELRRAPTPNEIRAAVDFAGLDSAHRQAVSSLERDYLNGTLPAQIGHLADAVRGGTKVNDLRAPIVGHDRLVEHLQGAARSGVESAVREGQVQGITFTPSQIAEAHATAQLRAAEQAEHVANLNAHGLTLGAQRRAGRISNTLRGREGVAKDLERHLEGQKHVFERENLKGAVTVAQNGGRIAAMEAATVEPGTATYEASEILDDRTCGPCEAIDGTEYESLDEAQADYGSGGYVDCDGGPNCRGTVVAVYAEQNPQTGEGPLGEAEPAYIGPTGPDTGDTSGTGDDGGGVDNSSPEEAGEPAPSGANFEKVETDSVVFDKEAAKSNLEAVSRIGTMNVESAWGNDAIDATAYEKAPLAEPERVVVSAHEVVPVMAKLNKLSVEQAIDVPRRIYGARLPDGRVAIVRESTAEATARILAGKTDLAVEIVEAWAEKLPEVDRTAEREAMLAAVKAAPDFKAAAAAFDRELATHESTSALGEHALREASRRMEVAERAREAAHPVLKARYTELDERISELTDQALAATREGNTPLWEERIAERDRVGEQWSEVSHDLIAGAPNWDEILASTLGEVREMGGKLDLAESSAGREAVDKVMQRFPSEWVDRSNAAGQVRTEVDPERSHYASKYEGERSVDRQGVFRARLTEGVVHLEANELARPRPGGVADHEFMHRFQQTVPDVIRIEREWWESKTGDEAIVKLQDVEPKRGYEADEITKPDEFADAYTGKVYDGMKYEQRADGSVWTVRTLSSEPSEYHPGEVATMGVQRAYKFGTGRVSVITGADDHAALVVGMLAGL